MLNLIIYSFLLFSWINAEDVVINNNFFPKNFIFGVATAAYQIEGAWNVDGKGENIWDWFTHTYPEKIWNNDTGDVACDSYHKWQEDVELLKTLGVNHYRLSFSWSRILPDGLANAYTVNQEGVRYYRNLLEELVAANITPYVTLYHWDLPLPLHQLGGWQNVLIADHFAAYARICFELFGDIVKNWITLNEPASYCVLGYGTGRHAPGYVIPSEGIYKCAYTSVLAHAQAYHIYDKEFRESQQGRISIVIDSPWYEPVDDAEENQEAALRQLDFNFGLYANPIYNGDWPERVKTIVDTRSALENFTTSRLPKFTEEQRVFINGTSDFFCLNTYSTYLVKHINNANESIDSVNPSFYSDLGTELSVNSSWASDVDWVHLVPEGFKKLLNYVDKTFGHPEIVITENGWAENVTTARLEDEPRITYVQQYLSALLDAVNEDSVNVTGYTLWSILDNMEWAQGFQQKLGLVQVNFTDVNRNRTIKSSYSWYQNVIKTKCLLGEGKCGDA